jgi:hypothetical protein
MFRTDYGAARSPALSAGPCYARAVVYRMGSRFVHPGGGIALTLSIALWAGCGTAGKAGAVTGEGGASGAGGAAVIDASAGGAAGGGGAGPDAHVALVDAGGTVELDAGAATVADVVSAPDLSTGGNGGAGPADSVVWAIDNTQSIAGHHTTVLGAPTVIDTPGGKALQFDGKGDALFVDKHPLEGMSAFTVEVIFRPDAGGAAAQRFFHMQDGGSGGRVLFETRLPGGGNWVGDVFVESPAGKEALYSAKAVHPLGAWYNMTAVIDGTRARHYVNGVEESSFALGFKAQGAGQTSIGVRITKMYYFKGAIRLARFTPRALQPAEFLKP